MPLQVSPSDSDAVFISTLVTGLPFVPVFVGVIRAVGPLPVIFLVILVESDPEEFFLGVREFRVQKVVNGFGLIGTGDRCKVSIFSGTSSFGSRPSELLFDDIEFLTNGSI